MPITTYKLNFYFFLFLNGISILNNLKLKCKSINTSSVKKSFLEYMIINEHGQFFIRILALCPYIGNLN